MLAGRAAKLKRRAQLAARGVDDESTVQWLLCGIPYVGMHVGSAE